MSALMLSSILGVGTSRSICLEMKNFLKEDKADFNAFGVKAP